LLPQALLSANVGLDDVEVVPRYLGPRDEPWLRALLDLYASFEGQQRAALRERLAEPLVGRAPKAPLRVARHVLDRLTRAKLRGPVSSEAARAAVFGRAAQDPEGALGAAAAELALDPDALSELLFADLASAERVGALPAGLSPLALAQNANLALASSLLQRAQAVRVQAFGNARALVRHAQLLGLICVARRLDSGVELDISGPFSLFRHTLIYGKRLASLIPRALWCERFELEAQVALRPGAGLVTFRLGTGDPLPAGRELDRYDSEVERRFARDFAKLASDWDLVREPEPLALSSGGLLFPDFALVHRRDAGRRVLLEIAGFWTAEYLRDKLARLRDAKVGRILLCVDERRACRDEELPEGAELVPFRRKVDAARVLARIEERDDRLGDA